MCSTAITSANYSNNFFCFCTSEVQYTEILKDFLSNTSYHFINNNNRSPTLYTVTKSTHFSKTADFVIHRCLAIFFLSRQHKLLLIKKLIYVY